MIASEMMSYVVSLVFLHNIVICLYYNVLGDKIKILIKFFCCTGLLKSNSGFSDNNEDRLKVSCSQSIWSKCCIMFVILTFCRGQTYFSSFVFGCFQEVLRNVSDEDILKTLTELGRKSEFSRHMLHSVQPQDIAAIVAGNESVLRSFPIDSVAETYISAISKSTGQNEKNMKAEELNAMFEWIPNKIILEALFSKIKLSDFVQNLEQKKSNDMLEALLMLIKKPSKQIRKVLLSKMSSLDIAEELDQKKSDDVLEALVCNVKEPSKHLRQVLFSKMSSSAILEELDEKKSEDVVLESLAYNLKKPSRQLKQMFLSKISSVDMVNELDEEKSEQLLEELLFKAKKLSKRCVEVSLPKMSPSDIASELVQTKSENLVEALVCNKGIKDVLLSKMSPSDIAKSARIKETLSMLIEFGQGVLKDADKSLPDG